MMPAVHLIWRNTMTQPSTSQILRLNKSLAELRLIISIVPSGITPARIVSKQTTVLWSIIIKTTYWISNALIKKLRQEKSWTLTKDGTLRTFLMYLIAQRHLETILIQKVLGQTLTRPSLNPIQTKQQLMKVK